MVDLSLRYNGATATNAARRLALYSSSCTTVQQYSTSWFKLKAEHSPAKVYPVFSLFVSKAAKFAHAFYEPLRTPDLAGCFWFVSFCVIVRFLGLFGKFETPWTTYFRQKIIKCKHPQEVKLREGHTDHGCDLSGSISLF